MSLVFNTPKSALNTTSKAIQNLKSGECPEPSLTTESVEYTENGEYSVSTPEGFDGLSAVSVTVNIDTESIADAAYAEGEAAQKAKLTSLNVTSNGTYNREDGYNSVTVNVPSSEPNLEYGVVEDAHLYGDYNPSEGYDGFATISVSVSPSAKGTASNPFTSMDDITDEVETAGAISTGSYYSVTLTEDDTIEYDPEEAGDHIYVVTKASTDSDYPDAIFHIVEGDVDSQDYGYHYKEWPTGFSLMAGDVLLLCGTDVIEGGFSMLYAYNGNLDETTWASSGCPDWSSIGWDCNDVAASGIDADLAYTAQKKAEFEASTITTFANDTDLIYAPSVTLRPSSSTISGLFTGCSNMLYVPKTMILDSNSTGLFSNCQKLKQLDLDASNVTIFKNAFYNCTDLKTITLHNATNVTNLNDAFYSPSTMSLTSINAGFSATLSLYQTFYNCRNLTAVPIEENTSIIVIGDSPFQETFYNCIALEELPVINTAIVPSVFRTFYNCSALTTLGGFANLGKAFTGTSAGMHTFDLSASSVLTKQSIMNIINNLAAPDDTAVTDATLRLSAASYALLSADDIAIATAKRWSVTSA